ncbi:MAG: hypothetical protein J1F23_03415 [Oscillospiraceae bacterium]|nr:hypothetical protein [Oscillospiraceae bacterium]
MKRMVLFLTVISMMIGVSGCSKYENEMLTDNKADFTAVAEFARSYYEEHRIDDSDHIAIDFYDGTLRDLTNDTIIEDVSDDIYESVGIISSEFDFLWVNDTYVIFWEDETKYYGLLWSESTQKAISSVKEWYGEMDYHKLEANWYEIGALDSI